MSATLPILDTEKAPAPPEAVTVAGPEGQEIEAKALTLAIEKFKRPRKHYRLIWVLGDRAWLCAEDKRPFRRAGEALTAGEALAGAYGARRFSQFVR